MSAYSLRKRHELWMYLLIEKAYRLLCDYVQLGSIVIFIRANMRN